MNTMKTMRTPLKLGLLAPLALASLAIAPHARADSVSVPPLLAQTTFFSGTNAVSDHFTTGSAGVVSVTLQSLDWPTPLGALSFSVDSPTQVLASWNGTGLASDSATFNVGAGTYFANIIATAGGTTGIDAYGAYSVLMTFTPSVPLPASGWMLLTGLFVLTGLARVVRPFELTGTAGA
jgi:hypothetical protein